MKIPDVPDLWIDVGCGFGIVVILFGIAKTAFLLLRLIILGY